MSTKRSNGMSRICATLMLLQMISPQLVLAQNAGSASNNTTGLPSSSNPDAWPWMQTNPDAGKHKDAGSNSTESSSTSSTSAASSSPSSAGSASPSPQNSTASVSPAATSSGVPESVSGASSTQEKNKAKAESEFKLQSEHAKPAEARVDTLKREQTAVLREERPATTVQVPSKSHMLFGRIEELTAGAGAKFPVLKAQTAKMDLSGQTLKAGATDNMFSGQIVRSFPSELNGTWGGVLQLQQIRFDPLYYQLDPDEYKQTAELMRPGLQGKVNLVFQNTGGGVTLEPAKIFFSAPMTESRMASQMSQLGGGGMGVPGMGSMANNPGMAQMMKSMMMSVPYIWYMSLGTVQGTGLSGNSVQTNVMKNDVRQLNPTVIEQQIVSQEHDTNPKTGRSRTSFSESVVRFTRYNASQQYVQAVAVDYSADKKFLRKMVFEGYVTKGAVQQMPDPMGGLAGLGGLGGAGAAGGAGGAGGFPGLGDLQKMFGGGGAGGGGGMPGGFDPNALKGLFGQ